MYVYAIDADCSRRMIVGEEPIEDLDAAVQKALDSLSDEEVVEPKEDWFRILVARICDQTGYQIVSIENTVHLDEPYWDEHRIREESEDQYFEESEDE